MPYALLGTNCMSQTNALTSNKKFYCPNNLIYKYHPDMTKIYEDNVNRREKNKEQSLSEIIESERPEIIKRFANSCCNK